MLFQPPTVFDLAPVYIVWPDRYYPVPKMGQRLRSFYNSNERGRSVLKALDGTYTTVDNPTTAEIEAAAIAYIGGHIYDVDDAEADALTAAGYGANLS